MTPIKSKGLLGDAFNEWIWIGANEFQFHIVAGGCNAFLYRDHETISSWKTAHSLLSLMIDYLHMSTLFTLEFFRRWAKELRRIAYFVDIVEVFNQADCASHASVQH